MSRMTAWGVTGSGPPRRRRRGSGAAAPQSQSYDFTGAMPAPFAAAWSGPTDYASGYPTYEDFAGRLKAAAAAAPRRDDRGLRLEPAVTNVAANPRMIGATAATLNGEVLGLTIAIGGIVPLAIGSHVYRVTTPSAHGRANFDRIRLAANTTAGGRTLGGGLSTLQFTIYNVTSTTFDIVHWQAATSTAANTVAVAYYYRTWSATGTLPTGMSLRGDSGGSRLARLTTNTDPAGGGTPFSIGAVKTFNIAGVGTDYLILTNVAATQAETIRFSQPAGIQPRRGGSNDDQSRANIGISLALIEKNSGGTVLRETLVDVLSDFTLAAANWSRIEAGWSVAEATCASVDIAYKLTGADPCDIDVSFREFMLSKSQHNAATILPAWNTTGTSSKIAETCAGVAAPFALKGADYVFECKEIVAATDTIISFGSVELRAVGTTWPRDLVLTDGTNSVTLAGALRDLWRTQQTVRASMSWGAGGLRLAMTDDFITGVRSGSNASFTGAAQNVVNLNEAAGGLRRGMTSAKTLVLHDTERSFADVIAASRLTFGSTWAVPGVDTVVGLTGPTPKTPPGTNGTFENGWMTRSGTRIFVNASAAGQVIENFDFRGYYFSANAANVGNVTFRNCRFDGSGLAASGPIFTQNSITTCPDWVVENCLFEVGRPLGDPITVQGAMVFASANPRISKCVIVGSNADLQKMVNGGTLEDSILIMTAETAIGAHADGVELNQTSMNEQIVQRTLVDFRTVYKAILEPNTAIGGSPANIGSTTNSWLKQTIVRDAIVFGGFNSVVGSIVAPNATFATAGGLYSADAQHTYENVRIGAATNTYVNLQLNGAQLRFVGAAVTFANAGGRVGCQHCVGLVAGTWPDGHRGGALKTTGLAGPALTTTPLNGLATAMAASDAFSINGNTITVLASGASGNNQINVTDTLATLIAKMQALVPGLTVTLEPYRLTVSDLDNYFSGAPLA